MSQNIEQPVPQGKYVPAVRHTDLIYTSGMTPRKAGKLVYWGRIRAPDPIESHRDAVRLATLNALVAAQAFLREGEKISVILQLNIFLNAEPEFTLHPQIMDHLLRSSLMDSHLTCAFLCLRLIYPSMDAYQKRRGANGF